MKRPVPPPPEPTPVWKGGFPSWQQPGGPPPPCPCCHCRNERNPAPADSLAWRERYDREIAPRRSWLNRLTGGDW